MTSGVPKTKDALARRIAGQVASGNSRRRQPLDEGEPATPKEPLAYLDALERIRTADARIKEARARKDEIANEKAAGLLIDAAVASDWSRRVVAGVLIEAEGLPAQIDLMGLPPEVAAPARAAAVEAARRLRNRIAALPDLLNPPKPGASA